MTKNPILLSDSPHGQICVICNMQIGKVSPSRFCEGCNRPIHDRCLPATTPDANLGCGVCGASREAIQENVQKEIDIRPTGLAERAASPALIILGIILCTRSLCCSTSSWMSSNRNSFSRNQEMEGLFAEMIIELVIGIGVLIASLLRMRR